MEMQLNIKTAFWRDGKLVKINSGKDLDRAIGQAITQMRRNRWKAHYVEVYDAADSDLLHAQVLRSPATGDIKIYERAKDKLQANRYAATPMIYQPPARLQRVK